MIITNLRLIHLNIQKMNLRNEVLLIIEKLHQNQSLNVTHLSNNNVPLPNLKITYKKMDLPHLIKQYFKSPEKQDTHKSVSETTEFKDVKKTLLKQEFNTLNKENKKTHVEQNACFIVNYYHLKQLKSTMFKQKHLEQEIHRNLQHQQTLVNHKPLFFYREFTHKKHKIFEIIKKNLTNYPNPTR